MSFEFNDVIRNSSLPDRQPTLIGPNERWWKRSTSPSHRSADWVHVVREDLSVRVGVEERDYWPDSWANAQMVAFAPDWVEHPCGLLISHDHSTEGWMPLTRLTAVGELPYEEALARLYGPPHLVVGSDCPNGRLARANRGAGARNSRSKR
jgi:hypothetical protein